MAYPDRLQHGERDIFGMKNLALWVLLLRSLFTIVAPSMIMIVALLGLLYSIL